jgi:predicted phage baseplate assembly protein
MQNDRTAYLRFGDGILGRRPTPGAHFTAHYRVGNGVAGNVGRETIVHYHLPDPLEYGAPSFDALPEIKSLSNPLPAMGGVDPEALDQVRLNAPQAFQVQERCVTDDDYAAIAQLYPDVWQARASRQWTGSWFTVFLTVLRPMNRPVDRAFQDELAAFLQPYLLTGTDVCVLPPQFVPLHLAMTVYIAPGHFSTTVTRMLLDAFSNHELPDGQCGFFYPGHFTFGQPVYLSQVIARARQVPGVVWLEVDRFQRWDDPARNNADSDQIAIGPTEIARLDNNPDAPEYGQITFTVRADR